MTDTDLRPELRWLSSGFLLTFCSSFGQTYFIAIFAGHLKAALAISDGQFGGLYTIGTVASAAALMWAGKLADSLPARWLGAGVMAGLALACLTMAATVSPLMLGIALFGLRFFGQGMMTHVAMTAMGRWFNRKRGRAIAVAGLGFPAGEALLPFLAVAATSVLGWRLAWAVSAAALLLLGAPALLALLTRERVPTAGPPVKVVAQPLARQWTRGEVLKSPFFYMLVPGVLAQSFIQTGIFFNQVTIVEAKGWQLSWFAASFPVLAAVAVLSGLMTGWLIDRLGAHRLLALHLLPVGVSTLLLVYAQTPYILPLFMAITGLTAGSSSTLLGALWAELYGTKHLGAIRALATAGVIFASALSPGLIGVLLDGGIAHRASASRHGPLLFCGGGLDGVAHAAAPPPRRFLSDSWPCDQSLGLIRRAAWLD